MLRDKYGLSWSDEVSDAQVERWFIQQGGKVERDGKIYGEGLVKHFKEYWKELWPHDSQTWWTDLILKNILENQFTSLVGPACVARQTRIPNPITGEAPTIGQLCDSNTRPVVLTSGGPVVASVPWLKGFDDLFEVTLASGSRFTATGQHLVLTENGFSTVEYLRQSKNPFVLLPESVSDHHRTILELDQSVRAVGAWNSHQTVGDFQVDCRYESRSCDEPLHWVSSIFQDASPSQFDALLCDAYLASCHMGDVRSTPTRNPRGPRIAHHATETNAHLGRMLGIFGSHRYDEESHGRDAESFLPLLQFLTGRHHRCSSSSQSFCSSRKLLNHGLAWKSSLGLRVPVTSIKHVGRDFFYDLTVPLFHHYFAEGAIHHNSSWKTGTVSRIALMDWSCFPDCTTVMQSSTDMAGLRSRIYGETTKMWHSAKMLHPWFPGFPLDSKCVITYRDVKEELARDLRDSVVGIPCKASTGKFLGMGSYSGRKNRRVWCIADEFQHMELAILDAQDNLISNGPNLVPGIVTDKDDPELGKPLRGYKCVFIANTNPSRPGNPIDVVSEPEHGWGSIKEDGKTKVWKCKKLPNHPVQCVCVNLDAKDSPNSPYPVDKPKWSHLAGPNKLVAYTEGSESYWSQGRGVFKFGLAAFKIITPEICEQFNAFQDLIWLGDPTVKIGMVDASYGGGDRCPLGWLEFGKCVDGKIRIKFHPYWLVPIIVNPEVSAEFQIAMFVKDHMEEVGVPPENFFFDGRGSLAMALASVWSPRVNSVEFGGPATNRPVGGDIYTIDKETKQRRLKLCNEHYSKFVSELWFSWLYATQADQIRGMLRDVVADAHPREWYKVNGDKMEIEAKDKMKKRTGCSPDLADMAAIGIEGARRRGFTIGTLANKTLARKDMKWLDDLAAQSRKLRESKQLNYAA